MINSLQMTCYLTNWLTTIFCSTTDTHIYIYSLHNPQTSAVFVIISIKSSFVSKLYCVLIMWPVLYCCLWERSAVRSMVPSTMVEWSFSVESELLRGRSLWLRAELRPSHVLQSHNTSVLSWFLTIVCLFPRQNKNLGSRVLKKCVCPVEAVLMLTTLLWLQSYKEEALEKSSHGCIIGPGLFPNLHF